jgi:5-hydroxyisourate hydrolase
MSPITTHVLNTSEGRPAAGISVVLEFLSTPLARGTTDADGRISTLLPESHALEAGVYCLRFDTSAVSPFFPEVSIQFRIENPQQHYHVPLLLSPYGYSTYRGS